LTSRQECDKLLQEVVSLKETVASLEVKVLGLERDLYSLVTVLRVAQITALRAVEDYLNMKHSIPTRSERRNI
jgi:hypothetical protein